MTDTRKIKQALAIPLLILLGTLILLLSILLFHQPDVPPGEYHYSTILRNHLNWLAFSLMMLSGFLMGYFFKTNPFLTGISLIGIFPITAIIEATIYRGSHNLIPAEMVMYFLFSLPAVGACAAGNYLHKRLHK